MVVAKDAAVIVDEITGEPLMVVVPDFDWQLDDATLSRPGTKQIRIPMDTYKVSSHEQLKAIVDVAVESLGIVIAEKAGGQPEEKP